MQVKTVLELTMGQGYAFPWPWVCPSWANGLFVAGANMSALMQLRLGQCGPGTVVSI